MKKKFLTFFTAIFAFVAINVCTGFKLATDDYCEDTKYCGSGTFTDESETINYAKREIDSYNMKGEVPNYYNQLDNSSCANVAGTVIIGYYDRFCEELIPNYKTYVQIGSAIKYRPGGFETRDVMQELHTLMGTDTQGEGTTYGGFQSGLKSYVNSRNYSYSISDLGNLDFNRYKAEIEAARPVAIFLDNFSFKVEGENSGTSEVINTRHCAVPHVVVGCGYKIDTYYNSNGEIIATRTYLKVASGLNQFGMAYLCLDGKSAIDIATSIIIQ